MSPRCLWEGSTIFEVPLVIPRTTKASGLMALLLLCLAPALALAQAPADSAASTAVAMNIRPRLCLLSSGEDACQDRVHIRWQSEQPRSLCLYQQGQPEPLYCWHQVRSGEFALDWRARASSGFQLRDSDSLALVAYVAIEVLREEPRRHNRRNPWSFF